MTAKDPTDAGRYYERVIATLDECRDFGERARLLSEELDVLPKIIAQLARTRRRIVSDMRKTMSAQAIADELGMSRARVYELLRD